MNKFYKIGIIIWIFLILNGCSTAHEEKKINQPHISEIANDEENTIPENTTVIQQLPFIDFKERWNAITDEQMSNLYINNLEETTTNDGTYYFSRLHDQMELRVFADQNHVNALHLINVGKSGPASLTLLTGWNQIVTILHPNIEINDVDELFNKIGVGPNGDLSNIKPSSFTYDNIYYNVLPTDSGYHFKASYDKPQ